MIAYYCEPNKKKFFDTVYATIVTGAEAMGLNPDFLLALSAHESEWLEEHNRNLNNLFGVTRGGKRNLSFDSLEKAMEYWQRNYQSWFDENNMPQTMEEFIAALRAGGPNGNPYNSRDEDYDTKLLTMYRQMDCDKKRCL